MSGYIIAKDLGYTPKDNQAIIEGKFRLKETLLVSINSLFGQPVWSWYDQQNERLAGINKAQLEIYWEEITLGKKAHLEHNKPQDLIKAGLPQSMVDDIRIITYFRALFPRTFGLNAKQDNLHPKTVVKQVDHFAKLLTLAYEQGKKEGGVTVIKSLSNLTLEKLKNAVAVFPYNDNGRHVRVMLRVMVHPYVRSLLHNGGPKITAKDIDKIKWPKSEKERESTPIIPNSLFMFLTDNARTHVGTFLYAMGLPMTDADADLHEGHGNISGTHPRELFIQKWPNFKQLWGEYRKRRLWSVYRGVARNQSGDWKAFDELCGGRGDEFAEELIKFYVAALIILLAYTGMRPSDLKTIHRHCLHLEYDHWVIRATHIKNQPVNAPIDFDRWLAIDIMRDASTLLEQMCDLRDKTRYFTTFGSKSDDPIDSSTMQTYLNSYLRKIDTQRAFTKDATATFSSLDVKPAVACQGERGGNLAQKEDEIDWWLNGQQFRTTLAYQLAREQVKLPYISMQLKHLTLAEAWVNHELPAEVTLMYGNIGKNLMNEATGRRGLEEARYEMALSLYGEGRPRTGGGAARHEERVNAYFKGARKSGADRENRIRMLARIGIQVVVTVNGFCQLNRASAEELEKYPPNCRGTSMCDPDCKQNVTTDAWIPTYRQRLQYALGQLNNPVESYNRDFWLGEAETYTKYLKKLGTNLDPVPAPA